MKVRNSDDLTRVLRQIKKLAKKAKSPEKGATGGETPVQKSLENLAKDLPLGDGDSAAGVILAALGSLIKHQGTSTPLIPPPVPKLAPPPPPPPGLG